MTTSREKAVCMIGNTGLRPDLIFPAEIRVLCILQPGLAAGVAGADAGVEAAATGQGAGMAARLAAIDCGVED